MRLIRRAAREGWCVEPEWKQRLPKRLAAIVADPSSKNRDAIGAAQTLLAMDKSNFEKLTEAYKLANPQPQSAGLTINAENVNVAALSRLASDPDAYAEFARLAEAVKNDQPRPH